MEQKKNLIRDKSYSFSLKIISLYRKMLDKKEWILGKQLLRSGTSIGANVEEALQAQSRNDFISKLSIALKEGHETSYWLRLLRDSKTLESTEANMYLELAEELNRILISIIKSTKNSDQN